MRLPRNAKIFRGQLDAAPLAGVTFLLLLFLVLHSKLVFNPGIRIDLPETPVNLPGTTGPTLVLAIDRTGQVYMEGQVTPLSSLRERLRTAVQRSPEPLTLEVQMDQAASWETTAPVLSLAQQSGVRGALLITRPRLQPLFLPARP